MVCAKKVSGVQSRTTREGLLGSADILDAVEGEDQGALLADGVAEEEETVARLLHEVGLEEVSLGAAVLETLVRDLDDVAGRDDLVKRVDPVKSLELGVVLEVNDAPPARAPLSQLVAQSPDESPEGLHLAKPGELTQRVDDFAKAAEVLHAEGRVGDGVPGISVAVVLPLVDLDRGVVAELVGAHELEVELDGALGDVYLAALVLVERVGDRGDKVVEGVAAPGVAEAAVEGPVPEEGVAIGGQESGKVKSGKVKSGKWKVAAQRKWKGFSAAQKACVGAFEVCIVNGKRGMR